MSSKDKADLILDTQNKMAINAASLYLKNLIDVL